MGRHANLPAPRAHWVLLSLFLVVLFGLLSVDGYVSHRQGAAGTGPASPSSRPAPAAARHAGPVLRLDGGRVTSRRVPARTVALTFDDGPDPVWTPRILAVLARHHATATFFVVGSRANAHPELVRRILAGGNEVGSHTFTHVDLGRAGRWRQTSELRLTGTALAGAAGVRTRLFRPPYSSTPAALDATEYAAARRAAAEGYLVCLADRDTDDWQRPGVDHIVSAATPAGHDGAVVLLHDGGGNRAQTVAAVDRLLTRLSERGYRFSTLSAALGLPGNTPATRGERIQGDVLAATQRAAHAVAGWLTWILTAAGVLTCVRLLVQLVCARRHRRRVRRRARTRRAPIWPTVTVVVPAYNEAANIAASVRSLVDTSYPRVEVVVVDDGSTDGTAGIVADLGLPGVRVLRQRNAGKPAALNTGIRVARGEVLVLVDGDTVFERHTIARLVQPLADPRVGAVSGNTKVANRTGLLGRWQHLEYVMGFNLDRRMYEMAECMPTVPGAIGAFRRDALMEVGGLSGETLAEDTDLTMALCRAGWRVVYEESARAWTEVPSSLRQLWRQRYRWCYGTFQSMWKHRRAVFERGQAGRLGRRALPYLLLFQLVLPLLAPSVDLLACYALVFLDPVRVGAVWLGFLLAQGLAAGYALRLDRESLRPLWTLPLQQLVYRQLLYLVVLQSAAMAVAGARLRWQRMHRTGAVSAGVPVGS
ncbi:bi-functional transferase/deacetylase [Actinocatenispora thailandica]|uniref:Bi-functional transferase/deacetylase n=1 Tax=Actinocatenispora thailandica TaxID=227318 RepID=A0A7R7HVD1_9ACTN|nr:bifunctional polysaccharide deacetylase/glycosyltransferase family 2 protein [Actinocatenispora thailandica]BCJ33618.1 bi-functional transferase/deacetylase [Actinocatenispora thailandica]